MDVLLAFIAAILFLYVLWPMTMYYSFKWIRYRAAEQYKREGGESEEFYESIKGDRDSIISAVRSRLTRRRY